MTTHQETSTRLSISPPPALELPGADIVYAQAADEIISPEGNQNCFANNKSPDGMDASSFSFDPITGQMIPLPDAGCN